MIVMGKLIKRYDVAAKELKALLPYYIIIFLLISIVSAVICMVSGFNWRLFSGAAAGTLISAASFFTLAVSCQNISHMNEKTARLSMNGTYALRYIAMFLILGVMMYFKLIEPFTAVIPLFVPKIGYTVNAMFFDKDKQGRD